jgi:hypothetical protein
MVSFAPKGYTTRSLGKSCTTKLRLRNILLQSVRFSTKSFFPFFLLFLLFIILIIIGREQAGEKFSLTKVKSKLSVSVFAACLLLKPPRRNNAGRAFYLFFLPCPSQCVICVSGNETLVGQLCFLNLRSRVVAVFGVNKLATYRLCGHVYVKQFSC